jgi:hypothetical protein
VVDDNLAPDNLGGSGSPLSAVTPYLSSDNVLMLRPAGEPWSSPHTGLENRTFAIVDIHDRDHGVVNVEHDPQSGDVRVHSVDARQLDRGLTHTHAADLLYDLRQVFPDAKTISGLRITGSRRTIRPEMKIPWPQETDPGTLPRRAAAPQSLPMAPPPVGGYENPDTIHHVYRLLGHEPMTQELKRAEGEKSDVEP